VTRPQSVTRSIYHCYTRESQMPGRHFLLGKGLHSMADSSGLLRSTLVPY
jgi:hypothetical protein